MSVFCGIDWGNTHHQVAVVNDGGSRSRIVATSTIGPVSTNLIDDLVSVGGLVGVAIERSEGILVERLHAAGLVVFPVSPRVSLERGNDINQRPVRTTLSMPSCLLMLSLGRVAMEGYASVIELACRAACGGAAPAQCYRTQVRVEAQLRETLLAYHPSVVGLFSSIDRDATLAFLRDYPNPDTASRVGEARMAGFSRRIGYTGRVPAAELIKRLRTNLIAGDPRGVSPVTSSPRLPRPSISSC